MGVGAVCDCRHLLKVELMQRQLLMKSVKIFHLEDINEASEANLVPWIEPSDVQQGTYLLESCLVRANAPAAPRIND